jgi:hypothetical protein
MSLDKFLQDLVEAQLQQAKALNALVIASNQTNFLLGQVVGTLQINTAATIGLEFHAGENWAADEVIVDRYIDLSIACNLYSLPIADTSSTEGFQVTLNYGSFTQPEHHPDLAIRELQVPEPKKSDEVAKASATSATAQRKTTAPLPDKQPAPQAMTSTTSKKTTSPSKTEAKVEEPADEEIQPADTAEETEAPEATMDEARAALVAFAKVEGHAAASEMLASLGASSISNLFELSGGHGLYLLVAKCNGTDAE